MILVTTEGITGKELEMLGLVHGSTIQTVNAVRDIGAGLKTLVGGELTKYNEMMNNARALATKRMVEQAAAMGADGAGYQKNGRSSRSNGGRRDRWYPLYFLLHYAECGGSHRLWYRGQNYWRLGAEYSSAAGTPAV